MAKLNYMDRDHLLREFEIDEDLTTMGREATNKLVVADASVSRQHAWVEKREDGYHLVDKNSSNGTFINGKKVTGSQKLNHNDKINLGNASIVFEDEEQIQATFILPRGGIQLEEQDTEPSQKDLNPNERPTAQMDLTPPPRPIPSMPPAPPKPAAPPAPPAPPPTASPKPVPPPPPAPAASASVCPSCKKPVEPGARFCGSCGAQIPAAKPAAPVPPPPARPPIPPPSAAPRPSAPATPVPAPKPGAPPSPLPQGMAPAPVVGPNGPLNYAPFGPRFIAYLIDGFIGFLLAAFPGAIAAFLFYRNVTNPSPLNMILGGLFALISGIIVLLYHLYFTGVKGATIGKQKMKLRVCLADGTSPIGMGKAFVRLIGYAISASICYIGFLMIIFDKEQHRGLHDRIAGTVVIKES